MTSAQVDRLLATLQVGVWYQALDRFQSENGRAPNEDERHSIFNLVSGQISETIELFETSPGQQPGKVHALIRNIAQW